MAPTLNNPGWDTFFDEGDTVVFRGSNTTPTGDKSILIVGREYEVERVEVDDSGTVLLIKNKTGRFCCSEFGLVKG